MSACKHSILWLDSSRLLAALESPITDEEFDLIYANDYADGWCRHDVSEASIQAMFSRVLAARLEKAKGGAA